MAEFNIDSFLDEAVQPKNSFDVDKFIDSQEPAQTPQAPVATQEPETPFNVDEFLGAQTPAVPDERSGTQRAVDAMAVPPEIPKVAAPLEVPQYDPVELAFAKERSAARVDTPTLFDRIGTFGGGVWKAVLDIPDEQIERAGRFLESPQGQAEGVLFRAQDMFLRAYNIPFGALSNAISAINASFEGAAAEVGKEIRENATERLDTRAGEAGKQIRDPIDEMLFAGGESLTRSAPGLALGGVAGIPAALSSMAYLAMSSGESQALREGHTADAARLYGGLNGIIEAGTELIPVATLLKRTPFKRKLVKFLLQEVPTELAATTLEKINAQAVLNKDWTAQELYHDLAITAGATILTGGAQVAAVNTVQRAAQTVETFRALNEKAQKDAASGKASREYAKLQQEMLGILEQEGHDVKDKKVVFHSSPRFNMTQFRDLETISDFYDDERADAAGVYFSDDSGYTRQYMDTQALPEFSTEEQEEAHDSETEQEIISRAIWKTGDTSDRQFTRKDLMPHLEQAREEIRRETHELIGTNPEGVDADIDAAYKNILEGEDFAVRGDFGQTYSVLLDDTQPFLDWKKPLTEQSAGVREILERNGVKVTPSMTGGQLYRALQKTNFGTEKGSGIKTSQLLNEWGIKGTKDTRMGKTDPFVMRGAKRTKQHTVYALFDPTSAEIVQVKAHQNDFDALRTKMNNFDQVREEFKNNPPPLTARRKMKNLFDAGLMSKDELYSHLKDELAFDFVRRWTMGLEQLADDPKNVNYVPLQTYRAIVHDRHAEWGRWAHTASNRVDAWDDMLKLSPQLETELNQLIERVGQVSEVQEHRISREEVVEIAEQMGLKKVREEHVAFLETVWDDYARAFEATRASVYERIDHATDDEQTRIELKDAVDALIDPLVNRNYRPKVRFGKWTNEVTDSDRNVLYRKHYRNQRERDADVARLRKEYKGSKVTSDVDGRVLRNKERISYAGVPDSFVEKLSEALGLGEEQVETVKGLQFEQDFSSRFVRGLAKDDNTPGWSEDYLRSYASFFTSFANRKASIDFDHLLQEQVESARTSGALGGDRTTQTEIAEWMGRHRDYLRNPGNEWQDARALGFTFYIGFVPKSVVTNLSQVPMVSFPVMSQTYGSVSTVKALTKAINQFFTNMRLGNQYTFEQQQALLEGRRTVLEENQGAMLGAVTAESNLQRFSGGRLGNSRSINRGFRKGIEAAAFLFQAAENFNRQITFTATYDLERAKGASHAEATQSAIGVVRRTHLEYARFNRAELMRGKKSVAFLFMQFVSQMMWLVANDPAKWRILGMMLMAGGVSGLPWAENISHVLDSVWTKIGKHAGIKDPKLQSQRDLTEFIQGLAEDPDIPLMGILKDMGIQPDTFAELMMHGTSRYVPNPLAIGTGKERTVDMSGSLSFGKVLPGTELLSREMDADRAISEGLRQGGGAVMNIPFNLVEAAFSDNPDKWRMMEKVAPTEPKHLTRMTKWLMTGMETDSKGDAVARFNKIKEDSSFLEILRTVGNSPEALAQGMGFAPTELNIKKGKEFDYYDRQQFYLGWRSSLLDRYWRALKEQNPTKQQAVMKAIHAFNKQIPSSSPLLTITGENVKESMVSRAQRSGYREAGTVQDKKVRGLYHETLGLDNQPLDYTQ